LLFLCDEKKPKKKWNQFKTVDIATHEGNGFVIGIAVNLEFENTPIVIVETFEEANGMLSTKFSATPEMMRKISSLLLKGANKAEIEHKKHWKSIY